MPKACLVSTRFRATTKFWDLLDPVASEHVFPVFEEILQVLEQQGQLESFCSVAGTLLIAIDGTEYFNSSQIHCSNCSTRTLKSGETHYFHSVITPVIVAPGQPHVIPLMPEFIVPQDGMEQLLLMQMPDSE